VDSVHMGRELVNERAQQAALKGSTFERPLSLSDFQSLARPALMRMMRMAGKMRLNGYW
jgi:hypothetical protein